MRLVLPTSPSAPAKGQQFAQQEAGRRSSTTRKQGELTSELVAIPSAYVAKRPLPSRAAPRQAPRSSRPPTPRLPPRAVAASRQSASPPRLARRRLAAAAAALPRRLRRPLRRSRGSGRGRFRLRSAGQGRKRLRSPPGQQARKDLSLSHASDLAAAAELGHQAPLVIVRTAQSLAFTPSLFNSQDIARHPSSCPATTPVPLFPL